MATAEQVSESWRNEAWVDYIDAERLNRYYYRLAARYQTWRHAVRLLILLSVLGNVVSALEEGPAWILWAVSVFVAVLLAVDYLGDHARKAAISFAISQDCSKLAEDYRRLWHAINERKIGEPEAIARLTELAESIRSATGRSGDLDLRVNERLNERCAEEADRFMVGKYVAQEA